jgi:hypothetical protein
MYHTAEVLLAESGHTLQKSVQPWERTDLHLLTSAAIGPRDSAWETPDDADRRYLEEVMDEDAFASPYREDPADLPIELYDENANVIYDESGARDLAHMVACSLRRFVVYFALQDGIGLEERDMFFLALHSMTSGVHFLEHLVTLFDMELDSSRLGGVEVVHVYPRILDFLKQWLSFNPGIRTVEKISEFLRRVENDTAFSARLGAWGPKVRNVI